MITVPATPIRKIPCSNCGGTGRVTTTVLSDVRLTWQTVITTTTPCPACLGRGEK